MGLTNGQVGLAIGRACRRVAAHPPFSMRGCPPSPRTPRALAIKNITFLQKQECYKANHIFKTETPHVLWQGRPFCFEMVPCVKEGIWGLPLSVFRYFLHNLFMLLARQI